MPTPHAGLDDPGTRCVGKEQAGTVALAEAVRAKWGGKSLGIYACRNVAGTNSPSTHKEGRAYDHAWTNRDTGFDIADTLIDHHAELGIQRVIWWRRIWIFGEGWYEYGGQSPHKDHLHIEQNWSGARWLTKDAARRILAPSPPPIPKKKAVLDMPIIYSNDADGEQLYDSGTTIIVITDGRTSATLQKAGVPITDPPMPKVDWDKLRAKATSQP